MLDALKTLNFVSIHLTHLKPAVKKIVCILQKAQGAMPINVQHQLHTISDRNHMMVP